MESIVKDLFKQKNYQEQYKEVINDHYKEDQYKEQNNYEEKCLTVIRRSISKIMINNAINSIFYSYLMNKFVKNHGNDANKNSVNFLYYYEFKNLDQDIKSFKTIFKRKVVCINQKQFINNFLSFCRKHTEIIYIDNMRIKIMPIKYENSLSIPILMKKTKLSMYTKCSVCGIKDNLSYTYPCGCRIHEICGYMIFAQKEYNDYFKCDKNKHFF